MDLCSMLQNTIQFIQCALPHAYGMRTGDTGSAMVMH